MGKDKVLVKVNPEGKYVVDLDKDIDIAKVRVGGGWAVWVGGMGGFFWGGDGVSGSCGSLGLLAHLVGRLSTACWLRHPQSPSRPPPAPPPTTHAIDALLRLHARRCR